MILYVCIIQITWILTISLNYFAAAKTKLNNDYYKENNGRAEHQFFLNDTKIKYDDYYNRRAETQEDSDENEKGAREDMDSIGNQDFSDDDSEDKAILKTNPEDMKKFKDELYAELEKKHKKLKHFDKKSHKYENNKYKYYKEKYKYYKSKVDEYKNNHRHKDDQYFTYLEELLYYRELYEYYKDHRYKEKYKQKYYSDDYYSYDYSTEDTYLDLRGIIRKKLAYKLMQSRQSMVCSPLSAMIPIGILSFGAEGKTLKEMLKAIGISSKSKISSHFKNIDVKGLSGIHMASRIYIDNHYKLRSSFKDEATNAFGSCIEQIDMRDPSKVSAEVNSWVRYHTNKRIDNLLLPGDVKSNTRLIIVDAIYFYGKWKYPMHTRSQETFYGSGGNRQVSMMSVKNDFYYGRSEELGARILQVPYKDRDVVLLILLPDFKNDLTALISQLKLSPDNLNSVKLSKRNIELRIPKFTIENEIDLVALYQSIDINKMFSESAGLRNMVKDVALVVDQAIQKTFLIIDEEATVGTSFASAMVPAKPKKDPNIFHCNEPFLFFIIANKQQMFAGMLK